jgi:hypothetical protein
VIATVLFAPSGSISVTPSVFSDATCGFAWPIISDQSVCQTGSKRKEQGAHAFKHAATHQANGGPAHYRAHASGAHRDIADQAHVECHDDTFMCAIGT